MTTNHDPVSIPIASVHPQRAEPSVSSALEHILEASQHMLADRVDLIRLETREALVHSISGVTLIGAGIILVLGGWSAALAIVVVLLDKVPLAIRLAFVMLANLAAGGALVMAGQRQLHGTATQEKSRG